MSDAPIGIVDSGVGGLTVARSVLDQLPHEPVRYVGDTARGPYGPRPLAEVREFAIEIMDRLVDDGVKMLVIACNSASAATLRDARERYQVPVVEVVHPAVRRAAAATRNGRIGVIGTAMTINSQAYDDAFAAAPTVELISAACPRFVEFVEAGVTGGDELLALAHAYLQPLRDADVDTLVLGCTHYPLLTGVLSYVMGESVTLVSSAEEMSIAPSSLRAWFVTLPSPSPCTNSWQPGIPPPSNDSGEGSSARRSAWWWASGPREGLRVECVNPRDPSSPRVVA